MTSTTLQYTIAAGNRLAKAGRASKPAKPNIIIDLDGTIALDIHRTKYLHQPCPEGCKPWDPATEPVSDRGACGVCSGKGKWHDWKTYFSLVHTDEPNHAVIELIFVMVKEGYRPHIISGRDDATLAETQKWLHDHGVTYESLRMRGHYERAQDDVMKLQMAAEGGFTPENTIFVLEDRQRVVDAWRKAGYSCFQVAPGNF